MLDLGGVPACCSSTIGRCWTVAFAPRRAPAHTASQTAERVVVFGHSHQPLAERRDGVLWFNPGSAGRGASGCPSPSADW